MKLLNIFESFFLFFLWGLGRKGGGLNYFLYFEKEKCHVRGQIKEKSP